MPVVTVPSNETMSVKCANLSKHKIAAGTGNKKSFDMDSEEYRFWERIPRQRREYIKRMHLESGECLLCIDGGEVVK